MSNQNYSEFRSRNVNANKSKKLSTRKGEFGAEHESAQKDSKTGWPKAPGQRSPSLNRVGFPLIKIAVNSDGVDV